MLIKHNDKFAEDTQRKPWGQMSSTVVFIIIENSLAKALLGKCTARMNGVYTSQRFSNCLQQQGYFFL